MKKYIAGLFIAIVAMFAVAAPAQAATRAQARAYATSVAAYGCAIVAAYNHWPCTGYGVSPTEPSVGWYNCTEVYSGSVFRCTIYWRNDRSPDPNRVWTCRQTGLVYYNNGNGWIWSKQVDHGCNPIG